MTYTQLIGSTQQSEEHTVIKVKRTSSLMCEDLLYKSHHHQPLSLCVNTETQAHGVMTFCGLFWYTERVQTRKTLLKAKEYALIIHNKYPSLGDLHTKPLQETICVFGHLTRNVKKRIKTNTTGSCKHTLLFKRLRQIRFLKMYLCILKCITYYNLYNCPVTVKRWRLQRQ